MILERRFLFTILVIFASSTSSFSSLQNLDDQNHDKANPTLSSGPTSFANSTDDHFRKLALVGVPATLLRFVNVEDFGAKGDGTDDSEAFEKAWEEACSSSSKVVFVVPRKRVYHLKPVTFSGPCKSSLTMKIFGTIKASTQMSDYIRDRNHWLVFKKIQNFVVTGGGTLNGNGKIWWENSCKINKSRPCTHAPTAVTFLQCKNLRVANLRIKNAQQMHLTFMDCVNVIASNLRVIAPGKSPNTDGIHVSGTQNIKIMKSIIGTGDDCVSIVSGSKNVIVSDLVCGPGHGISIGSLGNGGSEAHVLNVKVNRAKLSGTTNGVRIKTWQGGLGSAENIVFQNIVMQNVSNPIIIDQNYCDRKGSCPEQYSAVQVRNVVYKNIQGTSASEMAIKFNCSRTFPCRGILLKDVNLLRQGDGEVEASCANARSVTRGRVSPNCS